MLENPMLVTLHRPLRPASAAVIAFGFCVSAVAVGGCGGAPPSDSAGDTPPDTILHNANVVTVDAGFSSAEAVAITDGRFVAVGSNTDVGALAGLATRMIDVQGRTVVPGLSDGHLHNGGGGPGVDLSRARSLADVKAAIAARAAQTEPGEVVVTNSDWHEAQLVEHTLPLRRDLDEAAPEHPVVVVRGGHEYILNSAALREWAIDEGTPVPPGGRITRYPDGALNGSWSTPRSATSRCPRRRSGRAKSGSRRSAPTTTSCTPLASRVCATPARRSSNIVYCRRCSDAAS